MKRKANVQVAFIINLLILAMTLTSCTGNDYQNAVPNDSKAVVSIDVAQLATQIGQDKSNAGVLKGMLGIGDVSDCGIDLTSKIYLFESSDGNLGLVAKVSDEDDLDSWLNRLAKRGISNKTVKRGKCRFATIKDSWLIGFNGDVAVVMGPIITSQQALCQQQIIKYINQDEGDGLKASPLYDRLDGMDAPIAIVAQVAALPDKFAVPFSLSAPKADATQVYISAGVKRMGGDCISIEGETFSFDKQIDESIGNSLKKLRPITQKYIGTMSSKDAIGAFLNADGKELIELLHANKSFMALLAGVNSAIDMDNIIKSTNGDMAIVLPNYADGDMSIRMSAKLESKDFLNDVPYWKKSCPKGGSISDVGKDFYLYKDNTMNYYFGVSEDLQYYSGGTKEQALQSIGNAEHPLSSTVKDAIVGKRMCMVLNIDALLGNNDGVKAMLPIVKTLVGNANMIIYSVK